MCSEYLQVNCGVPQGNNFGLILFILYVSVIVRSSSFLNIAIFADDTTLSFETGKFCDFSITIDGFLYNVSKWLYKNKKHLTLNILKTRDMLFHKLSVNHHSMSYSLNIEGSTLSKVFKTRSFDVNSDHCSKFNLLISDVTKN